LDVVFKVSDDAGMAGCFRVPAACLGVVAEGKHIGELVLECGQELGGGDEVAQCLLLRRPADDALLAAGAGGVLIVSFRCVTAVGVVGAVGLQAAAELLQDTCGRLQVRSGGVRQPPAGR
jgi:hypothetical protein